MKYCLPRAAFVLLTAFALSQPNLAQGQSAVAPVVTIVSIQGAEGLTDADLTPAMAQKLEQWSVDMNRKKISQSLAASGQDPKLAYRMRIDSQSLVNIVGGKKLVIVRMNIEDVMREVSIIGIVGPQLYRVGCLRNSNHDIAVFSGECAKVLRERFKISLP